MYSRISLATWGSLDVGSFRRSEAVSYTHLRAHETVLDLVCRLLLEKKKGLPIAHVIYWNILVAETRNRVDRTCVDTRVYP